jgi:hypothetical protein
MSDYESHTGKLRIIYSPAVPSEETFSECCKRLWRQEGEDMSDYKDDALFTEYYEKYFNVDGVIWEVFDHEDLGDDDMFCDIHDNKDGTYSFRARFYNGGTCLSEMITEELEDLTT